MKIINLCLWGIVLFLSITLLVKTEKVKTRTEQLNLKEDIIVSYDNLLKSIISNNSILLVKDDDFYEKFSIKFHTKNEIILKYKNNPSSDYGFLIKRLKNGKISSIEPYKP